MRDIKTRTFTKADDDTLLDSLEVLKKQLYHFALDIDIVEIKNGRVEYEIKKLQ